MNVRYYGLKVLKSNKGYYVGRFFQEDEVINQSICQTNG